jgi:hypothetical protein
MKRSFTISSRYLLLSVGVYAAMAGASFGQIFQGNQRQNQPAGQSRAVGQARTQYAQPQAGQQRYQQGTIQYGQSAGQQGVQGQYTQPYSQWDGDQDYRQSQGGSNNQQEIERRLASIEREIRQLRQLLQQGSSQQSYTRGSESRSGQYDRQFNEEGYQPSGRYGNDRTQYQDGYEQQSYGRYSNDQSDYRSGSSGTSSGRNDSDYSGSESRSRTADRRNSSDTDSQRDSSSSRTSRSSNDEDEDYQSSSRSGSGSNSQRSNTGRTGESSSSNRDNSDSSQDD